MAINRANGFYANHSSGGNDWFNNTSYNNGTQYNLWASTWDAAGNRTDGVVLTGAKAHRMRNNIGLPNKNMYMEGVDTGFNTWDVGITPAASDFVSVDDTGTMGPRQPDGSLPNLDFLELSAGSPLIDKGTYSGTFDHPSRRSSRTARSLRCRCSTVPRFARMRRATAIFYYLLRCRRPASGWFQPARPSHR